MDYPPDTAKDTGGSPSKVLGAKPFQSPWRKALSRYATSSAVTFELSCRDSVLVVILVVL